MTEEDVKTKKLNNNKLVKRNRWLKIMIKTAVILEISVALEIKFLKELKMEVLKELKCQFT